MGASSTPGAGIVISNDNLAGYAAKGKLATVSSTGAPPPPAAASSGPDQAALSKKEMWRALYVEQQDLVQSMEQEIVRLDSEIPALWNQFYAWDDPAYRDGVIKPKLDEALANRERLEKDLAAARDKLPEILEQARRDGAQPGWFRDLVP